MTNNVLSPRGEKQERTQDSLLIPMFYTSHVHFWKSVGVSSCSKRGELWIRHILLSMLSAHYLDFAASHWSMSWHWTKKRDRMPRVWHVDHIVSNSKPCELYSTSISNVWGIRDVRPSLLLHYIINSSQPLCPKPNLWLSRLLLQSKHITVQIIL